MNFSDIKIKDVFKKKFLFKIGIPLLIIIIIIVVFVLDPFEKEQTQLKDLRGITESEKGADSLSSQFGNFLDREKSLKKVASQSQPAKADQVEVNSDLVYTAFSGDKIDQEFEQLSKYAPDFYFQNEIELSKIQNDISFFLSKIYE